MLWGVGSGWWISERGVHSHFTGGYRPRCRLDGQFRGDSRGALTAWRLGSRVAVYSCHPSIMLPKEHVMLLSAYAWRPAKKLDQVFGDCGRTFPTVLESFSMAGSLLSFFLYPTWATMVVFLLVYFSWAWQNAKSRHWLGNRALAAFTRIAPIVITRDRGNQFSH